jgi:hypothetical protein
MTRPLPMRLVISLTVFVLAAPSAISQPGTPHPVILYSADGVTVSGSTPGGQVILFGLSRTPLGTAAHTARRALVQVSDGTGATTFAFHSPVPRSSIYAAVDYETGAYAISTPDGYPLRLTPFPIAALQKNGGIYTQLGMERVSLEILCVRAKKGAWRVFLTDCSRNDRDGACDGKLIVDATAFQAILSTKEDLKDFKEHDVVIMIDPIEMDVMASEVGK